MKTSHRLFSYAILSCALAVPALDTSAVAGPAPVDATHRSTATPTQQATAWLRDTALAPGYPGARLLIATPEHVLVDVSAGHRDLARHEPLPADAIYRIYSMTKPIVSAAVLRLLAEGHGDLDDPVGEHLPELAGLYRVDDDGTHRPAVPTIRQLLTHTAGFAVEGPALARREAARLEDSRDLADYVRRLAEVPLGSEPGTAFHYDSAALDVLGRLVEVWSGQPLERYLRAEFFQPLGMRDTGFSVPVRQRDRVVELSTTGDDGRLVIADEPHARHPGIRLRPYPSAAGGLYSTAADYLAFVRMLMNGGEHAGHRYLPRNMVERMFSDQLAPMGLADPHTDATGGQGFGLGLAVLQDPALRGRSGGPGQVGWSGAASTYFVIDPHRRIAGILLLQHLPRDVPADLPRLALPFYNFVQQVAAP